VSLMQFEWDPEKAKSNITKHDVTFEEAQIVFYDPLSATFEDFAHSIHEHRFLTIGYSSHGHLLVVSHTERNDIPRIISARTATLHERKKHEEHTPQG
jgi:uncharacterized protein